MYSRTAVNSHVYTNCGLIVICTNAFVKYLTLNLSQKTQVREGFLSCHEHLYFHFIALWISFKKFRYFLFSVSISFLRHEMNKSCVEKTSGCQLQNAY